MQNCTSRRIRLRSRPAAAAFVMVLTSGADQGRPSEGIEIHPNVFNNFQSPYFAALQRVCSGAQSIPGHVWPRKSGLFAYPWTSDTRTDTCSRETRLDTGARPWII